MTTQTIGQYRIVRQLGEGGMGVVYEGVNDNLQKRVAIKVLHAEFSQNAQVRQRFFNEARAVNMVQHPGLVSVLEVGQSADGSMYLIMEFLPGESLRSRIKSQAGALPTRMTVRLLRQMALALAAAHQKRIVHRDLKPDNVMIVQDADVPGGERAKLLDFGIAKIIDDAPQGDKGMRTGTGMMMGTPAYMAPEQCRGAGAVDEKADVYSLGVMAFEMLCGQKPFSGEGPGELIGRHLFELPPALQSLAPHVPPPLAALVHRTLAKAPAERPTMLQLAQELDALRFSEAALTLAAGLSATSRAATADRSASSPNQTIPLSLATLGDATAQHVSVARSSSRQRVWVIGGGVAVMCMGFTAGLVGLRQPARRAESPAVGKLTAGVTAAPPTARAGAGPPVARAASAPPPIAPVPAATLWEVTTEPPGAAILQASDLTETGRSPWQQQRQPELGETRYIVRLANYQDQEIILDHQRSQTLHVLLKPALKPAAPRELKKPRIPSPVNKPSVTAPVKKSVKPRLKTDEEIEMFK